MKMSFIDGIISLNERSCTLSLAAAITLRTSSSVAICSFILLMPAGDGLDSIISQRFSRAARSFASSPRYTASNILLPCLWRISSTLPERMLRDLLMRVMWSHISSTDEVLRTCSIQNSLRIDTSNHSEGYSCREVGLDKSCDDIH